MWKIKEEEIQHLIDSIVKNFHPQKIILFGSYAWGKPEPDSDVDLLIILKTRNTLDTAVSIRQVIEHRFPVDIIVKTPKQVERRLKAGDSFISEIIKKGKVIYEAPNLGMD